MFYEGKEVAYRLRGVYRVHGTAQTLHERCRSHTALSFRIRGNSTFASEDGIYYGDDNTVMYFPSGVNYTRVTRGEEELIVIHLDAFGEEEKHLSATPNVQTLAPLFEGLLYAWEREGYFRAMELFYGILKRLSEIATPQKNIPVVIAKAYPYLKEHFTESTLTIATLSELCHVSEPYFRRIWRAHFGTTPLQSLLDMRFSYAKELFSTAYYSVKEVARMSGFGDEKYFRFAFKKRYGMTIGVYLRKK